MSANTSPNAGSSFTSGKNNITTPPETTKTSNKPSTSDTSSPATTSSLPPPPYPNMRVGASKIERPFKICPGCKLTLAKMLSFRREAGDISQQFYLTRNNITVRDEHNISRQFGQRLAETYADWCLAMKENLDSLPRVGGG